MQIEFLGAAGTVTGSKYAVHDDQHTVLVDCGLYQGQKVLRQRNWQDCPINPKKINAILLTHAHIDHSGYIPLLVKNGFSGPIYASKASYDLCKILLLDSGHLQEADAARANKYGYSKHKPALPLYTAEDARVALKQFRVVDFGQAYAINDSIQAVWHRAGHILGAAMIELRAHQQSILFSGDLGRFNDPIMKPPVAIQSVDYLVVESTYGDQRHENCDPLQEIADLINATAKRGGTVLIPSFAVGRTQTLLYYLYQLRQQNRIPPIPIYLDSPMASAATQVLSQYPNEHKLGAALWQGVCQLPTYIESPDESKALNAQPMPKIIISASGMATGGRVLHHLKVYGPNHRNLILFAGFQVPGTRGEKLVNGASDIKLLGDIIPIRAQVKNLSGLSAHADYQEILNWLKTFTRPPKRTFITHGENSARKALFQYITEQLNWECQVPDYLSKWDL